MEDKVLLAVLVSVLLVVLTKLRSRLAAKPKLNLPPGPSTLPLIGSIHHLVSSPSIYRAMQGLAKKHGPVMMLRLGEVPAVIMSSPEAAREVMKTNDVTFADRHMNATIGALTFHGEDLVFAPYGERWRQLRKICTLELLSAARVLSFRRIREEEVARVVRGLAASAAGGAAVDLTKTISRFVNDTFVREAAGSMSRASQEEFLESFSAAVRQTSVLTVADLFPSSRLMQLLGTAPRKALACRRKIERVLDDVIRNKKEEMSRGDPAASEGFLGVLLSLQREGGTATPLTDETIVTVMFDMYGAGSETSSTLLNWCMTALVRSPAVMAKAQAEVREAFMGKSTITEADIEGLSYLKMVIKETLRLYTPVPLLLPRMARETCQVMGYDIPKGTVVFTNVWSICRDPKYWDDPEEYRPERFENSNIDYKGTNYEFLPFGSGRRICPGVTIGVTNIELALASFLYHFDWKLPDGMEAKDVDVCEAAGMIASKKTNLVLHPVARIPPAMV
ncbi:hypothetical protein ACP70R_003846 [Stipagrostis hirtigluma subsp. patula]